MGRFDYYENFTIKVLLPQASVNFADFGDAVGLFGFLAPKSF
jgi:hypothetical protein